MNIRNYADTILAEVDRIEAGETDTLLGSGWYGYDVETGMVVYGWED